MALVHVIKNALYPTRSCVFNCLIINAHLDLGSNENSWNSGFCNWHPWQLFFQFWTFKNIQRLKQSHRSTANQSNCSAFTSYTSAVCLCLAYMLYVCESYCCPVRRALRDKVGLSKCLGLLRQYSESYPIIWWRAICYHYARRSKQVCVEINIFVNIGLNLITLAQFCDIWLIAVVSNIL